MEKLLVWQELTYRAVTRSYVAVAGSVDEITEGGPRWKDEEVIETLDVVSAPHSNNEWGIGYVQDVPVLYATDGPEGPEAYPVPEGFIHEQAMQGRTWRVDRAEIAWHHEDRPGWDGTGTIAESWHAVLRGYPCRIDRFTDQEGGGYAYTITDANGNPLRGSENEAADSFDEAERLTVAALMNQASW